MIDRYSLPEMKAIWTDEAKFQRWLKVEIAACEGWAKLGSIPQADMEKIRHASFDIKRIEENLAVTHHDVTAFLNAVAEKVGPASRFVHLGLTSSDVMDTALSLQLVDACQILKKDVATLTEALAKRAVEFKDTLMMGRTHGVHAEPITFGLKLALWVEEMKRNAVRLDQAEKNILVGKISGAVGTYATVPPDVEKVACEKLGLAPARVSSQILQRDRHAQLVSTLALIASSLEKFALEIRGLQRTEVLEVEEPFEEGQTGSSAMPHKKNPELSERVCGLSRLIRGYSVTALENVALWHERDISHSSTERIILPDSCLALDYMFHIFGGIIKGLKVYPERMKENLELTRGLVFSQRVLIALIEKGLSRQEAYKIVQQNAMKAWQERIPFLELLEKDSEVTSRLNEKELHSIFDYSYFTRHINTVFSRFEWAAGKKVVDSRE